MIRLSVDGTVVDVPAGSTLLDAVRALGTTIPTLCHDDRLTPVASCRTCLVAVDGHGLVPACSYPAQAGMEVSTEQAAPARRNALQIIVAGLPPRALDVPPDRSELVRQCDALNV
ncbi:MAG: formate dehydrogenase, alpha subunit, partial [Citricoccus sp.]|nr:formate dehydrogenase, alpha subunit [Citricoccus sp. WCRC_4]